MINSITWKLWLLWNKWILQWSKKKSEEESLLAKLWWWGKVNFHCMLMILWWACSSFLATIEIHQVFVSGNDVISLESRPLNYHVIIHPYSLQSQMYFWSSLTRVLIKSIQKQINKYEIKSQYPEETQPPIK